MGAFILSYLNFPSLTMIFLLHKVNKNNVEGDRIGICHEINNLQMNNLFLWCFKF